MCPLRSYVNCINTLAASGEKHNVWRPSVRLSVPSSLFLTPIKRAAHTQRDSPGSITWHDAASVHFSPISCVALYDRLARVCVHCTGWEYSVEATLGGYGPVEKAYHLCRRRRLVRLRQLVMPAKAKVDSEEKVFVYPHKFRFVNSFNR